MSPRLVTGPPSTLVDAGEDGSRPSPEARVGGGRSTRRWEGPVLRVLN